MGERSLLEHLESGLSFTPLLMQVACVLMFCLDRHEFPVDTHVSPSFRLLQSSFFKAARLF